MTRLNHERDVMRMAAELGLAWKRDPVGEISRFCAAKIDEWLSEAPPITNIAELESLVCDRLQLRFEEIWSDEDLDRIVAKYTAAGEAVFRSLLDDFDEGTFATLLKRRTVPFTAADLYIAVIDCRGSKRARRFFTRWHEIAHRLTMTRQLELPYHRSTNKPPLERLMDYIAGEIGFFPKLFWPALKHSLSETSQLTLAGVEAVRDRFCPIASFHSTLIASVRLFDAPAICVEAGLGLKAAETRLLDARQGLLFRTARPVPKLRALSSFRNDPARSIGLRIDRNMEIPPSSIIARLFDPESDSTEDAAAVERLEIWRHTNGVPVGRGPVRVEARRLHDHALVIIQPATPLPRTRNRSSAIRQRTSC